MEKNDSWNDIWGSDLMSYYIINYLLFILNFSLSSSNCTSGFPFPLFLNLKDCHEQVMRSLGTFPSHKDPVVAYSICNAFISPRTLPSALGLWSLSLLLYKDHSIYSPLPPQVCKYTYPSFFKLNTINTPEKTGTTQLLEDTAQDVASKLNQKYNFLV